MSFMSAITGAQNRLVPPRLTGSSSLSSSDSSLNTVVHVPPSLGSNGGGNIGKSRMFSNAVKATLLTSSTTTMNTNPDFNLFQPSRTGINAQTLNQPTSAAVVAAEAASISAARHVADITGHKQQTTGQKQQSSLSPQTIQQQSFGVDTTRQNFMSATRVIPSHHFQTLQPPNLSSGVQSQTITLPTAVVPDSNTTNTIGLNVVPMFTSASKIATVTKASPPKRHFRAGMASLSLPVPSLNSAQNDNAKAIDTLQNGEKSSEDAPRSAHTYVRNVIPTIISNSFQPPHVNVIPTTNSNSFQPPLEIKNLHGSTNKGSIISSKAYESSSASPSSSPESKGSPNVDNYKSNKEDDLLESLRSSIKLTNELLNHQQRPVVQTTKKEKDLTTKRRSESVFSMLLDSGGLEEPRSNESVRSKSLSRTPGTIKISFVEDETDSGSGLKNRGLPMQQGHQSNEEDKLPNLSVLINNERRRKEQSEKNAQDKTNNLFDNNNEKDVVAETAELLLNKAAELRSKRHSITSTHTTSSEGGQDSRSRAFSVPSGSRRQSTFGVKQGYIGIDVDSGSDQLLSAGPLITVTPPKSDSQKHVEDYDTRLEIEKKEAGTRSSRRQSIASQGKSRREMSTRSKLETYEVNALANKILELASPHNIKMENKYYDEQNNDDDLKISRNSSGKSLSSKIPIADLHEHTDDNSDAKLAERLEALLAEGANVDELSATIAADLQRSDNDHDEIDKSNQHDLHYSTKTGSLSSNLMETAVAQVLSTQAQTAAIITQQSEQFTRLMELQRVQSEQQAQILSMIASVASSSRAPIQIQSNNADSASSQSSPLQPISYSKSSQPLQGTPHRILSPLSAFESRSQLARAALAEKATIDTAAAAKISSIDNLVNESNNLYLAKDRLANHAKFHEEKYQRRSPSPPPKIVAVVPQKSQPIVRITTVSPDADLSHSPTLSERLEQARAQNRLSNELMKYDSRSHVLEPSSVATSSLRPFTSAISTYRRSEDAVAPIPSIFTFIPSFSGNLSQAARHDESFIPSQVASLMPQPFTSSSARPLSAGRSRASSTASVPILAERQSSHPRSYAELMKLKGMQTPVAPLRRSISIGRMRK
jgi:hypothetical protein